MSWSRGKMLWDEITYRKIILSMYESSCMQKDEFIYIKINWYKFISEQNRKLEKQREIDSHGKFQGEFLLFRNEATIKHSRD